MAGLDEAGFTIKTLRQGDVFPTTDYLHSYSPLPTSFTFESTCTDQWTLLNQSPPRTYTTPFRRHVNPTAKPIPLIVQAHVSVTTTWSP